MCLLVRIENSQSNCGFFQIPPKELFSLATKIGVEIGFDFYKTMTNPHLDSNIVSYINPEFDSDYYFACTFDQFDSWLSKSVIKSIFSYGGIISILKVTNYILGESQSIFTWDSVTDRKTFYSYKKFENYYNSFLIPKAA